MKKLVLAPLIDQTERWVNGCESVSAVMLLQTVGIRMDPDTFIAQHLPHQPYTMQQGRRYGPDPAQVYPGDPHDATGCGCYAGCIAAALQSALQQAGAAQQFAVVDKSGAPVEELCCCIDTGMPVVFWTTLNFDPAPKGEEHWFLPDGTDFAWKNGEHCVLLVGYDEEHYWFNDPWQHRGLCKVEKELARHCHAMQGNYAVTLQRR